MRYSYAKGKKPGSDKGTALQQAVLYMRVSTKEQEAEGFSIPAQRRLLEDYAHKQGLKIAEVFEDVETAKRSGRKAFQAMLDYLVINPQVRHLLVEKTDRLYRNFEDHVKLSHLGLNIHLVKEGELLNQESRSHQKLVHGFKLLMAKNYSDNLSEEVTKGMLEKARSGDFPVKAPVGYLNDRNERRIVLDPVRGPLVRQAFEMYATGTHSLADVRKRLIQNGFTLSSGNNPPKSTIDLMLKNPFYYGEFRWRGELFRGNHTPIISRELFDKVQVLLSKNKPGAYQDRKFAFMKFLTCAHCGCAITAEIKKERYVYYRCSYSKGKCQQKYVPEAKLVAQFGKILEGLQLDERFAAWVMAALEESERDAREYHEREMSRIQKEIEKIDARLEQMYEDKLDGQVTEEFWKRKSQDWQQEKRSLDAQLRAHMRSTGNEVERLRDILELSRSAHSLFLRQNTTEQRELLHHVTSNLFLRDGAVEPEYRKPFDLLAFAAREFKGETADSGPDDPKSAVKWAQLDSNQ